MYLNKFKGFSKLLDLYDFDFAYKIYTNILVNITGIKFENLISLNFDISQDYYILAEKLVNIHVNLKKPFPYIFKKADFIDIEINIEEPLLIPRQETMNWVYNLVSSLRIYSNYNLNILEIGTGSGAISLYIAKEFKNYYVESIDILDKSIQIAQLNQQKYNLKNLYIYKSNIFDNIKKYNFFDIIISNPPYISYKDYLKLDPMVKKWESRIALLSKDNGFDIIKKILSLAIKYINKNSILYQNSKPQLIFEIGYNQGDYIYNFVHNKYINRKIYSSIEIEKDYANNDRLVKVYL